MQNCIYWYVCGEMSPMLLVVWVVLGPGQEALTNSIFFGFAASREHDRSRSEGNSGGSGSTTEGKWGTTSGRGRVRVEVFQAGILAEHAQQVILNKAYVLQGVLRQIPVVGSVLNWFSPVQASQKGRSFNLTAGRTSNWSMPRSVISKFWPDAFIS